MPLIKVNGYTIGEVEVNSENPKTTIPCPECDAPLEIQLTAWSMPDGSLLDDFKCSNCGFENEKVSHQEWMVEWEDSTPSYGESE